MGFPTVKTGIQTVGAGLFVDVRPPATTQTWRITEVGSSLWAGLPPNAIPMVNVSLYDGLIQGEFLRASDLRGWYRKQNFAIDRAIYLRLTNTALAPAELSWSAELIQEHGTGPSVVRSAIQTIATGLTVDVRPPAETEDWVIYDFCSSDWLGKIWNGVPNLEVDLNDGVNVARIMDSTEVRQWEPEQRLFVNRDQYITLTNAGLGDANVGWSAELHRYYGAGASIVRTHILPITAGLTVDFWPPDGEEWEVTMIGSSAWVGISPLQFPDITAYIFDGAIASAIQTPGNWHLNGHAFSLNIDHDNYIRVLDSSGVGQNVGISAQLTQRYA